MWQLAIITFARKKYTETDRNSNTGIIKWVFSGKIFATADFTEK